jgi:predicted ATP-dependent serine protease
MSARAPLYKCAACRREQTGRMLCGLCGAPMPGAPFLRLVQPSPQPVAPRSRPIAPSRSGGVEPPVSALLGGQAPSLIASEGLSRPTGASPAAPSPSRAPAVEVASIEVNEAAPPRSRAVSLGSVARERVERVACGWGEVDATFGGGMPVSRVVLLGGIRGTGKTALALPISVGLARATRRHALYWSAEGESAPELAGKAPPELQLDDVDVVEGNTLEELEHETTTRDPSIVVVDSIQSMRVAGCASGTDKHAMAVIESLHNLSRAGRRTMLALSQMNGEGQLRGSQLYQQWCDSIAMLERDELGRVVLRMDGKNRGGPIDRKAAFRFDDDGALRGVPLEVQA